MNTLTRITSAAAIAAVVVLCPTAFSQPASGVRDAEQRTTKLAKLLKKRGYLEVPLTLNKTGLLDVKVEVDGVPMLFVLDTGANNPNLDRASALRAKLTLKPDEEKTAALGGAVQASVTTIGRFAVGDIVGAAESYVVDLSPVNTWRKERGDPPCDGVLGGSWLKHYSAIISYSPRKLYLLDPAHRASKLSKRMKKDSYLEVPLELNKNGLLDVKVEVNGTPMLLFVDTGYTTTVSIERTSTKRAELTVNEKEGKALGLGGNQPRGETKIERLSVGRIKLATDAQVVDFSPTNATRKANGALPCDGVLGGRFMERYSAVIDYAHEKLYLHDRGGK